MSLMAEVGAVVESFVDADVADDAADDEDDDTAAAVVEIVCYPSR